MLVIAALTRILPLWATIAWRRCFTKNWVRWIQVRAADREAVESVLAQHGLADCVHYVGQAVSGADRFVITANGQTVFSESRTTLRVWWAETTWQMQRLRDNPECADQGASGEI
ncbi:hypothetical protein ACLBR5_10605 [Escherichia coli]